MSLLMFTRTEKDMLGNRENVYLKICNSLSINLIMSTKTNIKQTIAYSDCIQPHGCKTKYCKTKNIYVFQQHQR